MNQSPPLHAPVQPAQPSPSRQDERLGIALVALSALFWSFGGAIARFIEADDPWTVIFWRSLWAALFLIGFMIWRDGVPAMLAMFRRMGVPGLIVSACFATASTTFVVALQYTTVANIVLLQAGVPLIAALMGWVLFRERVSGATWLAIAAVVAGVAIMVSDSFSGVVSPIGDSLALLIAVAFATATVITRRYAHVRMTPATCLGTLIAGAFAATQASTFAVSGADAVWLFCFGALNLGLGLALFATGARLVPSAVAALLGTLEPVLAPIWVWLAHGEVPSARTILGGTIIFAALMLHIAMEWRRQSRPQKPGVTGSQTPL